MRHLKKFNERHEDRPTYHRDSKGKFHSDIENYVDELVAVITNDGEVLNKRGFVEEGVGIFDSDGNEYPAGIDKKGIIYGSKVGVNDEILTLDTEEEISGFKLGMIYNPTFENVDNTMDAKLNELRDKLVDEIKSQFYIHYTMNNEDGDEETTQMLDSMIERYFNQIKSEYRESRITKVIGD